MTLVQLRAFGFWMCRKTVRLPLVLFNQVCLGLQYLAKSIHEDGFIGVVLAFLITILGFMAGFIPMGIYLECVKEEGQLVHIGQVAFGGLISGAATAVTIFFYTCWYCFKREQEEIFNKLKETQRG